MKTQVNSRPSDRELVAQLSSPEAYPEKPKEVVAVETHISWIFLTDSYAYKVKKPVRTRFLDYRTLSSRKRFCFEERRLDCRYAEELYLDVVPIAYDGGKVTVEGRESVIDYAVKMKRFPADCLLADRLKSNQVDMEMIRQLAKSVAEFHDIASRNPPEARFGAPEQVYEDAKDNFLDLQTLLKSETVPSLASLAAWTDKFYQEHSKDFEARITGQFVRECHGDLHLENIIAWKDKVLPFDGIEFNDAFRWIDVLSDAAFLAMDFASRGRRDFCHGFVNAYLELTGDYESLSLLRWYLVYRSLVRAKVAAIRMGQAEPATQLKRELQQDCVDHVALAGQFQRADPPRLWITHGVSGSGKSTLSERMVQRHGMIRLRSDVERKRLFGLTFHDRPKGHAKQGLYSSRSTESTYQRLCHLSESILRSGFAVVVDATNLRRRERELFKNCASRCAAEFGILDCQSDEPTIRQRVLERARRNDDASDADLTVLQHQLMNQEPLNASEQALIVKDVG